MQQAAIWGYVQEVLTSSCKVLTTSRKNVDNSVQFTSGCGTVDFGERDVRLADRAFWDLVDQADRA